MDVEASLPEYTLKLLLLGASCVGKSELLARWASGDILPQYVPTLACRLHSTDCRMKVEQFGEVKARVFVWELSGNENHGRFLPVLFRSLDAVLCVFSLADSSSFELVGRLINEVVTLEGPRAFLIGTHADCDRNVRETEISPYVSKHNMKFLESSRGSEASVISEVARILVESRKKADDESKKKESEKGQTHWCCIRR